MNETKKGKPVAANLKLGDFSGNVQDNLQTMIAPSI